MSPTQNDLPSLITQVLRDELWFGDSEPVWTGSQSCQHALKKRMIWVTWLRRLGSSLDAAGPALADLLETCTSQHRCMSGACPECMRAFQRWFVTSIKSLTQIAEHHNELLAVRIAFEPVRYQYFHPFAQDSIDMTRAISLALDEPSPAVNWMAGALDFCLHDHREKGLGVIWHPQVYAIASVSDRKRFRSLLAKRFQKSDVVATPVQISSCDSSLAALASAYKTDFFQRCACRARSSKDGETRELWNTRRLALPDIDSSVLSLWLHEIGLVRRLYLWGVEMATVNKVATLIPLENA
jgi:hypothetical protein